MTRAQQVKAAFDVSPDNARIVAMKLGMSAAVLERLIMQWSIKRGSRVVAFYDDERAGCITAVGVEVSQVRWDDGRTQYICNRHLGIYS